MTPQGIAAIAGLVPAVLDRREPGTMWPPDIVVVDDGLPEAAEIEEALFPPDQPGGDGFDEDEAVAEPGKAPQPDLFDAGDPRRSRRPDGLETVDSGGGTAGRLRRIFGGDWPGAPGSPAPGSRFPNTDAFAFYMPWHRFSTAIWGIYLTVEGVEDLGRLIHHVARDALTRTEAKRAAKLFLFHHEAYHNAVETYAARLEVSHRHPCYRTGVVGAYATLLPETGLHEEGLANAYAHEKVRGDFLSDVAMPRSLRQTKRRAAAKALREIVAGMSAFYASGIRIIDRQVAFDDAEFELQEVCHRLAGLRAPPCSRDIWLAFPHAMTPSLARNKNFSYVIDRAHPALRQAAQVPRFNRTDVIRRLREATGAWEEGGGKHPKIVLPNGRKIPVPGHTDIPRGTVRAIIRAAGITMPLDEFMSAAKRDPRPGAAS